MSGLIPNTVNIENNNPHKDFLHKNYLLSSTIFKGKDQEV